MALNAHSTLGGIGGVGDRPQKKKIGNEVG